MGLWKIMHEQQAADPNTVLERLERITSSKEIKYKLIWKYKAIISFSSFRGW